MSDHIFLVCYAQFYNAHERHIQFQDNVTTVVPTPCGASIDELGVKQDDLEPATNPGTIWSFWLNRFPRISLNSTVVSKYLYSTCMCQF